MNIRLEEHNLCLHGDDRYRESVKSWADLLRDFARRDMRVAVLALGDGVLGFWNALREVSSQAREGHGRLRSGLVRLQAGSPPRKRCQDYSSDSTRDRPNRTRIEADHIDAHPPNEHEHDRRYGRRDPQRAKQAHHQPLAVSNPIHPFYRIGTTAQPREPSRLGCIPVAAGQHAAETDRAPNRSHRGRIGALMKSTIPPSPVRRLGIEATFAL